MNMVLDSSEITGTMISYYHFCKRRLWFFAKGVDMENITPTDDVIIGRLISRRRFQREKYREMVIGNSIVDFLEFRGTIVVHEVKKSPAFEDAHVWQVKYYIYLLRKAGFNAEYGVIHYPKKMRKVEIIFEEGDDERIEETLDGIREIISSDTPPPPLEKPHCKKCSYYELCYI